MRFVRRQSRISTNSLADGLGIRWSLALDYLEQMKRKGIVGDMQEDGWWPVLRKEAFSTPRKSTNAPAKKNTTPPEASPAPERMEGQVAATPISANAHDQVQRLLMEKLHETIRALAVEREKNHKLGNNFRLVVAEREAWKHRALAAEARIVIDEKNEASEKRIEELSRSLPDEALSDTKPSDSDKPLVRRLFPKLESVQSE